MKQGTQGLFRDAGIIALSIVIALILAETGILHQLLASMHGLGFLSSFIAGLLFTSVFTTAPAIVALGEIARENSLMLTALFGALGAMCGDYIIFRFIRDDLSKHLSGALKAGGFRRLAAFLKSRGFRWVSFLLGGLIIASPFPDELGLSLLGFSKMSTRRFLLLSFVFNCAGILLIGLAARALA